MGLNTKEREESSAPPTCSHLTDGHRVRQSGDAEGWHWREGGWGGLGSVCDIHARTGWCLPYGRMGFGITGLWYDGGGDGTLPVAVARGRMMGVSLTWLVGGQVVHGGLLLWMDGIAGGGRQNQKLEGDLETSVPTVARRYVLGFQVEFFVARPGKLPDRGRLGWGGSGLAGAGSCFRGLRGRPDGGRRFAGSGGAQGRREEGCMCFAALGCGWLTSGSRWMDHGWMQPVQCLRGRALQATGRATLPSFARADLRDPGWFFQVVASLRGCTQTSGQPGSGIGSAARGVDPYSGGRPCSCAAGAKSHAPSRSAEEDNEVMCGEASSG